MRSASSVAVSCFSGVAIAVEKDGRAAVAERGSFAASLKQNSHAAVRCIECQRLEAEFLGACDQLRTLTRLRRLTALEEKQLIDRGAMAIARIKEHEARHDCDRCKKGLADK